MLGNCVIYYSPQKMLVGKLQSWADFALAFRKTGLLCQISNSNKTNIAKRKDWDERRKKIEVKKILIINEFK